MDKILLKKIEDAMDKAMTDFKADEESIFNDKKETLIFKYKSLASLKQWKKEQTCIVRNCNKKSIERSHTIQKSGSIKHISEYGHVLTPRVSVDTGNIDLHSVGINDASTFPGYCSEHEKLFEDFETIKDFQTSEHFGLQLYRTICREIVITENHINRTTQILKDYKEFRDKKIGDAIIENIGKDTIDKEKIDIENFKFSNKDYRLNMGESNNKEKKRYLNEFLIKIHDAILNDLSKKKFQKIAYRAIVFDKEIPVTLAGRGNFYIKLKSKNKLVEVILNVLPLKNKTFIFIATLKKFTKELDAYMSQFANPLQAVSMIENWMIHGTDHWFLKPSVWEKVDKNKKQEIIESILDDRFNISHEFKFSIFNELKMESIKLMEANYDQLNSLLIELLKKEKYKLTFANNGS